MNDIRARAERNGKVHRTIAKIEQTIQKLERMKDEYMQKATDAKARGETASYNLAKSAINTSITQIKRAKEMLLSIQITAELQKMGDTNADFLKGMSLTAKRISKINKQSDFVKLQKEIDKALSGVQEAQAGLDGFLQNSDAAFATLSSAPGALSESDLDALIDGKITEKQLMMDDEIEKLMAATGAVNKEKESERVAVAADSKASAGGMGEPFPKPSGSFDFSSVGMRGLTLDTRDVLEIIKRTSSLCVCGDGAQAFSHTLVLSLVGGEISGEVKFIAADTSGELSAYNGLPQAAANAITDASAVPHLLSALKSEAERRLDILAANGVRSVKEYNAAGAKLPYVVAIFAGDYSGVDGFTAEYNRLALSATSVGMITVLIGTRLKSIDTLEISGEAATLTSGGRVTEMELPRFTDDDKRAVLSLSEDRV